MKLSKREFLFSALATAGQNANAQKGRVFLQLTLYDRIPEKGLKPYFEAIDREYVPETKKAPGLISYQRFRHYDLPEKASVELWESEQAAKAWHESERARKIWKAAMASVPQGLGVGTEYREVMHSMVHRHYFLE